MRRMGQWVLIWAVILLAGAAAGFEGTITMRTVTVNPIRLALLLKGQTVDARQVFALPTETLLSLAQDPDSGVEMVTSTQSVSGSKVRIEGNGDDMIADVTQDTIWIMLPAQKAYTEWHRSDANTTSPAAEASQKALQEHMANTPSKAGKQVESVLKTPGTPGMQLTPSVRPLGKVQTINGMQATAYEVDARDRTTVAWMTKAEPELARLLKMFLRQGNLIESGAQQQARVMLVGSDYGVPVRMQTVDSTGYHLEDVMQIQAKPLPADLFTVPKGFTKAPPQSDAPAAKQPK